MNKEKQIEGMAKDVCTLIKKYESCEKCDTELGVDDEPCIYKHMAKRFAIKGYRKASEVAREIIEEAEKIFMFTCASLEAYTDWQNFKKKYTEGEG